MAESSGAGATTPLPMTSSDVTGVVGTGSDMLDLHALALERLEACPADRLARLLGLRTARAAETLRAHDPARRHLAYRLGEGCADLPPIEADRLLRALLGDAHDTAEPVQPEGQKGVRDG